MSIIEQYLEQAKSLYISKNYSPAKMYARKVIKRDKNHVEAITLLGLIHLDLEQYIEAESYYIEASSIAPNSISTLSGLLSIAEVKQDFFLAKKYLNKLIELQPLVGEHRYKLGMVTVKLGDVAIAEQCFKWCIENEFSSPTVQLNLGHIYKAKGETDRAADFYHQYLQLSPNQAGVGYWSLADLKQYKFSNSDLALLQEHARNDSLNKQNQALVYFALCKAYEQFNQLDKACESMLFANKIMAIYRPFKQPLFAKIVLSLLGHTPSPNINNLPTPNQTPIFIIGMPRSGTTLVEQILASHTEVGATDELPFMERFALKMDMNGGYQSQLSQLSNIDAIQLREQYLTEVNKYFIESPSYFIDKNPNNFLHIGLIKTLFPNAKIINVIRNAVDNGLSVFKQYFSLGHEYSYSFDHIESYWQHYLDLMAHWDKLYPDEIQHICFEKLVLEPDTQIQQILDYCGLSTQAKCFTFYESERAVLTPSASQVKQPMNPNAIGQAEKYQPYIKPEVARLKAIAQQASKQFFSY
ncbi:tetratricopeptide repeat-containing sulfotransferase family protein [Shewanella goraebulensis]|uniref:tetratricopeptide repeat-containing sulfotransferase family protein n=1 Tax=Shewanella goraebulensis TaxID=3050637 RepID=UPI00254D9700|nr:tetratricopeptide repeat-containing sulfotransferase family protein [Shewanella goraebulensis]